MTDNTLYEGNCGLRPQTMYMSVIFILLPCPGDGRLFQNSSSGSERVKTIVQAKTVGPIRVLNPLIKQKL